LPISVGAGTVSGGVYQSTEVGKFIDVDPDLLDTVIRNLVTNAIKFTQHHKEVTVMVTPQEHQIEVSVHDTGTGIPAGHLSKLFRIDSKYSLPGTDQEKRSGLGLILSKEFVEKHDGKIWAESVPGTGSTFRFTLPL
jgi:signal transduction histidine kinase